MAIQKAALSSDKVRRAVKRAQRAARDRSVPTKPELKMAKVLRKLGWKFEFEPKVGTYFPDFVISSKKLVIEVNGTYWHSSRKTRRKDERKKRFLESRGFRVLVFTDKQLNQTPEVVAAKVRELIEGN